MVEAGLSLSPQGKQRMDAALPQLLCAVRARRRRRHARRAAAVVLLAGSMVGAPIAAWWADAGVPPCPPPGDVAVTSRIVVVDTDPAVLARCVVPAVDRAEWYVDDAGLQELLRADDR